MINITTPLAPALRVGALVLWVSASGYLITSLTMFAFNSPPFLLSFFSFFHLNESFVL